MVEAVAWDAGEDGREHSYEQRTNRQNSSVDSTAMPVADEFDTVAQGI